jgi:hypothetical protein
MNNLQSEFLAICIYAAFAMALPFYPLLIIGGFLSYQPQPVYHWHELQGGE